MPTSYPSPEGATPPADGAPQPVESPPLDLPAPPEATDSPGAPGAPTRVSTVAGVTVIVLLCAVCLGLAFRSGAYRPVDWLPFLIGVAALAVVVGMSGPAVLSGRVQKVLLGLFGAQAAWTAASLLWATSTANAWEETNRTLFYATAMTLVFVAVRWTGALGLRALVMLVTAAIAVMALVVVVRLGISDDFSRYFPDGRLQYPVGYFNGLASLLMIGFWLALGMANGSRGGLPRWIQPLLLALGVLFAELALLPQSRGALWTFFLAVPFFLILSTNRFRALVDLAIVVLPVALFWSHINGTYAAVHDAAPFDAALKSSLRAIGYSVLIVLGAWAVSWLVESRLGPLSRRIRIWTGATLIVLAVAGAIGGLIYSDVRTGGLDSYLGDQWEEFTSDRGAGAETGSRFTALGLNQRVEQWEVAVEAFSGSPLLGIGAQNFEIYHYQHRTTSLAVRQPHSQPLQLLAELGLPGLLLWLAFVFVTLIRAAAQRFRAPTRAEQAVIGAVMTAVISWFIHSSVDWLWQLAAVTLPVMMLLGGLVGSGATSPLPQRALVSSRVEATSRARALRRRWVTRPIVVLLALAAIVSAALPYLSLRYCDMASSADDLAVVTARTETAAALDPTSAQPFAVRATAYELAAGQAPEGSPERVEQLEMAIQAWVDATQREPGSWLCYYKAAEMSLAARDAMVTAGAASSGEELEQTARTYLDEARRLNPLSPQAAALEKAF